MGHYYFTSLVDEASVIEKCSDGGKAMSIYRKYHLENP